MSEIIKPRVLVVEDEPLIRMLAADAVADAGLEVIEAEDAAMALDILVQHPEIAILFTDIDMPGDMNGIGLANTVRDRWPPVKIVVTSGKWTRPVDGMPSGAVFVPKPYDCSALTRYFTMIVD